MKIVISINTSWNIYNFRSGLVKFLQSEGHEVIAIAPKDEYSDRLEKELGCKYFPIKIDNKGSNPFKDLKLTYVYYRLYKKIKPDAILQYTIKPNIYGSIAAKRLGIPTVNNVSGLGTIFLNTETRTSKIGMMLYKIAFKSPKKVFFQNPDDKNLFMKFGLVSKEICDVLPGSGVDLERFRYSERVPDKKKVVFLMIARVLYDKGMVEYVDAARMLLEKYDNIEFQLLGSHDGSKGSIPENEFTNWQKEGVIKYLGTTDNVYSKIEKADCIVLPSYREGTPKTLLEALAIGRPIVTTRAVGCKETVKDGENGYLCKTKSAGSLADSLERIVKLSDDDRNLMGKESRKLAESKFAEKFVFDKYKRVLDGIYKI